MIRILSIVLITIILALGCGNSQPTDFEIQEMQRVADLIPTTYLYKELSQKGFPPQWSNPRKMKADLLKIVRDPKYKKINIKDRYIFMAEDAVNIMVNRRIKEIENYREPWKDW